MALDRVKQNGRRVRSGGGHFRDRADLEVAIRPLDNFELAHLLQRGNVMSEISENHSQSISRALRDP